MAKKSTSAAVATDTPKAIYVTRWGLTRGIIKMHVTPGADGVVKVTKNLYARLNREYFLTLEEAQNHMELRRTRRLKSLLKERARLKYLDFSVVTVEQPK